MIAAWPLVLLSSLSALSPPSSVATSVPPPRGLEAKLVADGKDGKLDQLGLLEAALVASGVPDGEVAAEAKRVREALAPAVARARTQRTAAGRGDVLLRALHETVLRRYADTATELDDVVRTGEYNCLSSALLYVVAAEGLLESPRAMVTRRHAYARVSIDGRGVDVETTTPRGFDADRDKLMTPAYVRQIAGPDVSPAELLADLKSPEELPVLSLVAGVYSNRAVGLVRRGDLAGAAVALDRAARLASGGLRSRAAAWRAGVLNGGAVALVEQGRSEDARALLELALEGSEGETKKLLTGNLATVHLTLADVALGRKDWTAALVHVEEARARGASARDLAPLAARANAELAALEGSDARCQARGVKPGTAAARQAAVCLASLAHALRDKDVDVALQHARRAVALAGTGPAAPPDASRILFFVLVKKAKVEGDRGRCDHVEALVREALPHVAALDGQRWSADEVMGLCWARRGDDAFDKQAWDEAARLYGRAAAHLPREEALRGNLARVDVNRAIALATAGRCDDARPLARRAARVDASLAEKTTQLLESCAAVRAKRAADEKDWDTAAAELRRGLRDAPASAVLKANLGTMVHNLAAKLLKDKRCDDARALLPELEALGRDAARDAVTKACP